MTSQTFFLIFIPILAFILLAVNIIFAPHNPYQEKNSAFECGFHSFLGQNRSEFSISFFIFALLFLLFDLEILLVYPYIVSTYVNGGFGLTIMLAFFLVLTLGFAFELGKNALSIDSRQNDHTTETNDNTVKVNYNSTKTKPTWKKNTRITGIRSYSTMKNVSGIMKMAPSVRKKKYNTININSGIKETHSAIIEKLIILATQIINIVAIGSNALFYSWYNIISCDTIYLLINLIFFIKRLDKWCTKYAIEIIVGLYIFLLAVFAELPFYIHYYNQGYYSFFSFFASIISHLILLFVVVRTNKSNFTLTDKVKMVWNNKKIFFFYYILFICIKQALSFFFGLAIDMDSDKDTYLFNLYVLITLIIPVIYLVRLVQLMFSLLSLLIKIKKDPNSNLFCPNISLSSAIHEAWYRTDKSSLYIWNIKFSIFDLLLIITGFGIMQYYIQPFLVKAYNSNSVFINAIIVNSYTDIINGCTDIANNTYISVIKNYTYVLHISLCNLYYFYNHDILNQRFSIQKIGLSRFSQCIGYGGNANSAYLDGYVKQNKLTTLENNTNYINLRKKIFVFKPLDLIHSKMSTLSQRNTIAKYWCKGSVICNIIKVEHLINNLSLSEQRALKNIYINLPMKDKLTFNYVVSIISQNCKIIVPDVIVNPNSNVSSVVSNNNAVVKCTNVTKEAAGTYPWFVIKSSISSSEHETAKLIMCKYKDHIADNDIVLFPTIENIKSNNTNIIDIQCGLTNNNLHIKEESLPKFLLRQLNDCMGRDLLRLLSGLFGYPAWEYYDKNHITVFGCNELRYYWRKDIVMLPVEILPNYICEHISKYSNLCVLIDINYDKYLEILENGTQIFVEGVPACFIANLATEQTPTITLVIPVGHNIFEAVTKPKKMSKTAYIYDPQEESSTNPYTINYSTEKIHLKSGPVDLLHSCRWSNILRFEDFQEPARPLFSEKLPQYFWGTARDLTFQFSHNSSALDVDIQNPKMLFGFLPWFDYSVSDDIIINKTETSYFKMYYFDAKWSKELVLYPMPKDYPNQAEFTSAVDIQCGFNNSCCYGNHTLILRQLNDTKGIDLYKLMSTVNLNPAIEYTDIKHKTQYTCNDLRYYSRDDLKCIQTWNLPPYVCSHLHTTSDICVLLRISKVKLREFFTAKKQILVGGKPACIIVNKNFTRGLCYSIVIPVSYTIFEVVPYYMSDLLFASSESDVIAMENLSNDLDNQDHLIATNPEQSSSRKRKTQDTSDLTQRQYDKKPRLSSNNTLGESDKNQNKLHRCEWVNVTVLNHGIGNARITELN